VTHSSRTFGVCTNRCASFHEYSCHGRHPNRCSLAQSKPPLSAYRVVIRALLAGVTL